VRKDTEERERREQEGGEDTGEGSEDIGEREKILEKGRRQQRK
jgi:hypothetical protein